MSESATKVSTPPADDVEALLLELWRGRSDAAKISSICERLIQVAPTDLEKVEMYLPQFAHLVIALHVVLPTVAPIERFLLTVCQLSIHIALQFFWLVYAALQENRIKLGKDRDAYRNCARLLLQLEQCVVYGGGGALAGVAATATTANELMQECVRVASESQSSSVHAPGEHVVHSGLLRKQGGGTSRFGRKTWHERYFEVRDRVLYYYSSQANAVADKTSPSDRPRGSMQLTTAIVSCPKNEDRPNYFEVRCRQSGLKFCLEAPTKDVMGKWILTIQAVTALPEPPGMQPKDVQKVFSSIFETAASDSVSNDKLSELSDKISDEYIGSKAFTALAKSGRTPSVEVAQTGAAPSSAESKTAGREVYAYFDSQREFVRTLTNLAEELRYLQPEERQAALQPRLDAIAMPPGTYFPLAHSSEKCARLLRFTPNESVVFNTKARCPIMLLCEVAREPYTLAEIHKHIGTNAEPVDSAAVDVQLAVTDGPTLAEKKREAWVAKSSRLKQTSTLASKVPGWELTSFIVKSNDDLRQEVFIMQMIRYFDSIWPAELCWLNTYHIEATGPDVSARARNALAHPPAHMISPERRCPLAGRPDSSRPLRHPPISTGLSGKRATSLCGSFSSSAMGPRIPRASSPRRTTSSSRSLRTRS